MAAIEYASKVRINNLRPTLGGYRFEILNEGNSSVVDQSVNAVERRVRGADHVLHVLQAPYVAQLAVNPLLSTFGRKRRERRIQPNRFVSADEDRMPFQEKSLCYDKADSRCAAGYNNAPPDHVLRYLCATEHPVDVRIAHQHFPKSIVAAPEFFDICGQLLTLVRCMGYPKGALRW